MDPVELRNAAVRAVVVAIAKGDRAGFLAAFEPSAQLTDDGEPRPLTIWAEGDLF